MLPQYITAIKTTTYDTAQVRQFICDVGDDPDSVTDEEILAMIDEWAYDDLGRGYILLDEEGEEL